MWFNMEIVRLKYIFGPLDTMIVQFWSPSSNYIILVPSRLLHLSSFVIQFLTLIKNTHNTCWTTLAQYEIVTKFFNKIAWETITKQETNSMCIVEKATKVCFSPFQVTPLTNITMFSEVDFPLSRHLMRFEYVELTIS